MYIDLNADLGESFGVYTLGNDPAILDMVTSANIACGLHAGDPSTMRKTVQLALEKGASIGAHPGLPDLLGFGRRPMVLSPQEVYDYTVYQIGALFAFVKAEGGKLQHVKPHGALYNMASVDFTLAEAIAKAVYRVDSELILFGLAGSDLIRAGKKVGLRIANEVFADRTYQADGTLTSRQSNNALLHDPEQAVRQVIEIIKGGRVRTVSGEKIPLQADTICIHGDGEKALEMARLIHHRLLKEGIRLQSVGITKNE
ncbi:LamB/YcsF family protein [Thermoflavimicrobium daqui]|uniref:5-oxoprolinase subunit A n=1 Tax=Thermoflavimicrobium daqui TaxID=2137476 RepID=A0A364K8Y5_9BACL|nr:5-oxoprolinase subunit PxpA [Thermoflavimicrobium daqui]RAL26757.1 LamB/YcsF family protein [Thermoflavimicrobium daqui]